MITKAEECQALHKDFSVEEMFDDSYRQEYLEKYHESLDSDISKVASLVDEEEFIYKLKDDDICFFLVLQSQESDFVNHGILLEEKTDKFFIIGADIPGRNMPITLHIPCDAACMKLSEMRYPEFSKEKVLHEENKIMLPVYQGDSDRIVAEKYLPTSISMPLSKNQKEYVSTKAKRISKEEPGYYFIQHLDAMTKGQLASHLKKKNPVTNYLQREELLYDILEDKLYTKERGKWKLKQEDKVNEK